jgi:hypothetical protein
MKKVAVIGCSHTSYDQVAWGPSKDGKDWVHHFSTLLPDVEFHSFAAEGHGPLYYDYVLKDIALRYPPKYFDTLIIQYTVGGRWIFPLKSGHYFHEGQNQEMEFEAADITNNYKFYRLYQQRVTLSRHRATAWYVDRTDTRRAKTIKNIENSIDGIYEPDGFSTRYEANFCKLLIPLYGQYFNNVFTFDFSNTMFNAETVDENFKYRNNIGKTTPFKNYLTDKYGFEHVAMHFFDSSNHCSKLGNEVLVNEYLIHSKLGGHFNLIGKQVLE